MKTTIETNGYQILISEEEGKVLVSATKDDEVVEEFTLDLEGEESGEEGSEEGSEDLGQGEEGMVPFGEEEEDFGDEEDEEDGGFEEEAEEESEGKLESFNSFVRKRK